MIQSFSSPTPTLNQLNIYLSAGYSYTCQGLWNTMGEPSEFTQLPINQSRTLPVQTIVDMIDEAIPLGLKTLCLTGISSTTDPLLYAPLDSLLEQLDRINVSVSLETHGAGLRETTITQLARLPRCKVRIALAGASPSVHDGLLSAPGAFVTATNAARQLSQEGIAVELVFPVIRRNSAQVPAAIRLAEQLGAQSLLFIAVSPLNHVELTGPEKHPADDKFRPLAVEELIALGRKVERQYQPHTRVTLLFDQPPAFRGLHPSARVDGQHGCAITNNLSLLPNGALALCGMPVSGWLNDNAPEQNAMALGRAGYDRLVDLWRNHPMLSALREGQPERLAGVCERCAVQSACLGRCPIENHLRTGSFWGPYWFCEAAERAGLFPAGRLIENRWY